MARTNTRVSALIFRSDTILVFKRIKNGEEYWVIPGGGVEEGETVEEALKREVREETQLDLISFKHAFDFSYSLSDGNRTSPFFICETQGEPSLGDGPEKQNTSVDNQYILMWIPVADLNTLPSLYPNAASEIIGIFTSQQ